MQMGKQQKISKLTKEKTNNRIIETEVLVITGLWSTDWPQTKLKQACPQMHLPIGYIHPHHNHQ